MVIDENYKDVSRLLANVVKLKRRRWYNDPRTWGALGAILLVGLGIYLFPILRGLYRQPAPVVLPTQTIAPAATATLLPTPTSIPLTWKRVSIGQEFERDTVTAFATDKKDPDVIYAAMKNAGVYKSIDGGLSWRPAHQGLASTQVESLLIDSQNPRILYAGTIGGVFKTEDGGENWRRIGDGTYLLIDYQNNSHLYAHDENGIYETIDQGNNWTTAYSLNKDCPGAILSWAIHPANGSILFIGSEDKCGPGVYQSTDNGTTWKLIGGVWDRPSLSALAIGLNEQGDFSVYNRNGISHDGGDTWYFTDAFGCNALAYDPDHPATIYCAYEAGGLMTIKGKGSTWQRIGLETTKITAIHVDYVDGAKRIIVGGTRLYENFEDGVFVSTDGSASWDERDGGLGSTRAELVIYPADSTKMYLGTYYPGEWGGTACTLYRSLDVGKSWSSIRLAEWCGPAFDTANVIHIMQSSALQQSWNGGETWLWEREGKLLSSGRSVDFNAHYRLPDWDIDPPQSISTNPYIDGLIYSVGNKIYYSPDSGVSWEKSVGSEGSRDARLFYTDQSKIIYAIGQTHQSYSTDNGVTWQACGQDVTASRSDTRLALDLGGSRLYLATPGQGVLVSVDNCGSWQPSNNGLTNLFVNTLAIDPNNPDTIYAGTDGGAYISYDAGATWGQVNDGLLGATVVYSIAVDKDSNVYAATPYGVFKLEIK
ncbi:MAG: WD40/YVTN/BNR-like repeat-containing protein [Chloroflexota bacterium]